MDHALEYQKPREAALIAVSSPEITKPCQVLVRALWSGISRGTERLVFEGRVPESEYERMRAPFQRGDFSYPVIYGYSMVGIVEDGPQALVGKTVFALYPHQSRFVLPTDAVTVLPDDLPPRRATLAANMETALNAVWDGGVGPGDRVAIVGGGVVGGLLAGLCGAIPGADVTLVDVNEDRRSLCDDMNVTFATPDKAPSDCDIVFHTSASSSGLETAIRCTGFEGTLVEMSWYGEAQTTLQLGGAFHSQRLRIVSSQVGHVSPSRRARWHHGRRMAKALSLLCDPRFDAMLTGDVVFRDLAMSLPDILSPDARGLATAVHYGR